MRLCNGGPRVFRGTCQSVTSYSASRTMMCTKSPAEGRTSPFLLSRGTCLYPVWEHKVAVVSDQKKENMKSSLLQGVNRVLYARLEK